jgi:hypothetical protein
MPLLGAAQILVSADDLNGTANGESKLAICAPLIDGDFGKSVGILVPKGAAGRSIAEGAGTIQYATGRGQPCFCASTLARSPVMALPKWST